MLFVNIWRHGAINYHSLNKTLFSFEVGIIRHICSSSIVCWIDNEVDYSCRMAHCKALIWSLAFISGQSPLFVPSFILNEIEPWAGMHRSIIGDISVHAIREVTVELMVCGLLHLSPLQNCVKDWGCCRLDSMNHSYLDRLCLQLL